ncbi:hypothetical protein NL533_32125, partial [Klebsiella pneumoniae]|nr:hypothetical protein [Klebsiella pneumoniae]
HKAHLVWLLACLFNQSCFAELNEHALGASGNERPPRFDQNFTGTDGRSRYFSDFGSTVRQILEYLFHELIFTPPRSRCF